MQLWHGTRPLKKICYDVNPKVGSWRRRIKYTLRDIAFALFPLFEDINPLLEVGYRLGGCSRRVPFGVSSEG